MLNLVTLPIPKTLTNYYVVVSTTRVDLNVNDVVQVSYKKLGNSPRHTILSHANVRKAAIPKFIINYLILLLRFQRAIASDILTNVCTIQMSIVWALHWISTVNMKVEVCARIAVTTHKASTVTNASQHFIVLMINLLMLPTYVNVSRKTIYVNFLLLYLICLVSLACQCDEFFSTGNCAEGSGQCECRPQYLSPLCDQCSFGYYGYPQCKPCDCNINGTRDQICEVGGGQCPCKYNYAGNNCDECAEGYYNFPECIRN